MSELTQLQEISKNLGEHLSLFSEAEMERDQKTYCTFRPSELHNTKEAIDELLALRSRDVGDDEVQSLHVGIFNLGIYSVTTEDRVNATEYLAKLRDIAITRGHQLREAQAEIERLKGPQKIECCTCGHEMVEVDGQFGCEHCDHEYDGTCECWQCNHSREHESMKAQIITLTAERDDWKSACFAANAQIDEYVGQWDEMQELKAELAALKAVPGMEEVDALVAQVESDPSIRSYDGAKKLADLARRSIAKIAEQETAMKWQTEHTEALEKNWETLIDAARKERDEVVGLLKWLNEFWDFREVKECLYEYASDKVYGDDQQKARRIIEIVEGK